MQLFLEGGPGACLSRGAVRALRPVLEASQVLGRLEGAARQASWAHCASVEGSVWDVALSACLAAAEVRLLDDADERGRPLFLRQDDMGPCDVRSGAACAVATPPPGLLAPGDRATLLLPEDRNPRVEVAWKHRGWQFLACGNETPAAWLSDHLVGAHVPSVAVGRSWLAAARARVAPGAYAPRLWGRGDHASFIADGEKIDRPEP